MLFVVGEEEIESPFVGVAVHVVESPWVRFFLADGVIFENGIAFVPGMIVEEFGVISEGVSGGGASAAGVFPFCFGGESVVVSGLSGEPFAKFGGGVLGDADGWVVGLIVSALHFAVHAFPGIGGLSDCVDEGRV